MPPRHKKRDRQPPIAQGPSRFVSRLAAPTYHVGSSEIPPRADDAPLAPIDPVKEAGTANVKAIRCFAKIIGLTCLLPAMDLLIDSSAIVRHLPEGYPGEAHRVRFTNEKYKDHFHTMLGFARLVEDEEEEMIFDYRALLVEEDSASAIRFFSTYFAVPKTSELMRTIFNGRALSKHWKTPPPVNIADTAALIKRFRRHVRDHQQVFAITLDLRNWFHQLKVSPELSRHFGVAMNERNAAEGDRHRFFRWKTLPMGWSYSPWIAQSFALGLATARERTQTPLFDEACLKAEQLPTFVPVIDADGRECGFMTVYYDNVLFVSSSETLMDEFTKRFSHHVTNDFNVYVKPGSVHEARGMEEFQAKGLAYLGVLFSASAAADKAPHYHLTWRPEKAAEWAKLPALPARVTARSLAQVCGRLVFYEMMRLRPLCSTTSGQRVALLLRLAATAAAARGWDADLVLDPAQVAELERAWQVATSSPAHPFMDNDEDIDMKDYSHIIASDASGSREGWIFMERQARGQHEVLRDCTHTAVIPSSGHIYMKEMRAACSSVLAFFARFPDAECVVLAVDNSAVYWGLYQGYTTHVEGKGCIDSLADVLPRVHPILVVSGDNPSDCPSRDEYGDFAPRCRRLLRAVAAAVEGQRVGQRTEYDHQVETVLRHAPPTEAGEPLSMLTDPFELHLEDAAKEAECST